VQSSRRSLGLDNEWLEFSVKMSIFPGQFAIGVRMNCQVVAIRESVSISAGGLPEKVALDSGNAIKAQTRRRGRVVAAKASKMDDPS